MKTIKIVYLLILTGTIMKNNAQKFPKAKERKGLQIGAVAPKFEALNQDSTLFNLEQELKNGPVVMIFYRGFWCPICNKHIKTLQENLKEIEAKGATVIAVSPEKPEYLDTMADKTGATFTLLYDEDYKIADAYEVSFRPDSTTLVIYNTVLGAKLKQTHSDDTQRLPIPATYIIGTDGLIKWRHFDPDYKKRSTIEDILNNL
ncbi:MAG: peroxiredoxin-like family protein [Bacteroidales bacterium]